MASCAAQAEIQEQNTRSNLHVNQVVNSEFSPATCFWDLRSEGVEFRVIGSLGILT